MQVADVIFLPGGMPDLFMQRLEQKGIVDTLKHYIGVVIGCSAGAMIQFSNFYLSPSLFYEKYIVCKGIGMINGESGIEVHYSNAENHTSSIENAINDFNEIYLVDDNSGVIVENGSVKLLGNAVVLSK